MIPLRVGELAAAVGGRLLAGDPAATVSSVTLDSRSVAPGSCFFAIIGHRDDGHRYVGEAAASGAAAVVVQRPVALQAGTPGPATVWVEDTTRALQALGAHVRDQVGPRVVAITGSIGKTTTRDLAAELLRRRWRVHASPGNLNNHWGLPLALLGLRPGHQVMVAELAATGPGEIGLLARLAAPEVGLITTVAPVHMEFFGDLEAVAAAKAELAAALPPHGTLIVNADDPRTAAIGRRYGPDVGRLVGFGRGPKARVRALEATATAEGWHLRLAVEGHGPLPVRLPLHGEHGLYNFLAAAAVAVALELPPAEIAAAAPTLAPPPMRGRHRRRPDGVTVIDDSYNASPVAMRLAVEALARLPVRGRRVLAAGEMLELGSWADEAHRQVGAEAARRGIDLLVAVGELAAGIAEGAREAGMPAAAVLTFATPEPAAEALEGYLRPGDVVLVKGSRAVGMERLVAVLLGEAAPTGESPGAAGEA